MGLCTDGPAVDCRVYLCERTHDLAAIGFSRGQNSNETNQLAAIKLGISVGILATVFCQKVEAQTISVLVLDQPEPRRSCKQRRSARGKCALETVFLGFLQCPTATLPNPPPLGVNTQIRSPRRSRRSTAAAGNCCSAAVPGLSRNAPHSPSRPPSSPYAGRT
jgi:hypothetical protein